MQVGLTSYLIVAALLFCLGLYGVLTRRNAVAILMGIELMLNAANINLVAFNRFVAPAAVGGQVFALVIITLAACEAAVGLALVMAAYRSLETIHVDEINLMKWRWRRDVASRLADPAPAVHRLLGDPFPGPAAAWGRGLRGHRRTGAVRSPVAGDPGAGHVRRTVPGHDGLGDDGRPSPGGRLRGRPADRGDALCGDRGRLADLHLFRRLHARRSAVPALLCLPVAVCRLDAVAGAGQQLPGAVRGVGAGGSVLLPADRVLVRAPRSGTGVDEGVRHHPGGRLFHVPGYPAPLLHRGVAAVRCGLCRRADRIAGRSAADPGGRVDLRRGGGQVGADPAARVAP